MFPVTRKTSEKDVLDALEPFTQTKNIKCIQITPTECWITLSNEQSKENLLTNDIMINGKQIRLNEVGANITHVTVKDASIEISNDALFKVLARFGEVVLSSMRLGKIRGTDTLNGTRYLDMRVVQGPVPVDLNIDEFPIRVLCDNGKTECKHCNLTTHPSYRCPVKPRRERRCYRCLSTIHNINECSNNIVCKFCSQSGHKEKQCDNKREIEVFGDYRHEINEGRRDSFEEKVTERQKCDRNP